MENCGMQNWRLGASRVGDRSPATPLVPVQRCEHEAFGSVDGCLDVAIRPWPGSVSVR